MEFQTQDLVLDNNFNKYHILNIFPNELKLKKEQAETEAPSFFQKNLFWEELTQETILPKTEIVFNMSQFLRTYRNDTNSSHCRCSNTVKQVFGKNLEKHILSNLQDYLKINFKLLFYLLSEFFLKPYDQGGGKLTISSNPQEPKTFPKGTTSIGVLICYDTTMNFIRCSNKHVSSKVYLIKDNTKGPWNFCVKVLNFKEGKEIKKEEFVFKNDFTDRIYYVRSSKIIKKLKKTKSHFYQTNLESLDGDEIESYICGCWNTYQKQHINPNYSMELNL